MTAQVRIYAYPGLASIPIVAGGATRPLNDGLYVLAAPYLGSELLEPDTSSAANSDPLNAPAKTRCLQVQVQPGKSIHHEITPANQTLRVATATSPIIRGETTLYFAEGYRISVLEALQGV